MASWNRAIVFLAWGEAFIEEVANCIRKSALPPYPICLITDAATPVALPGVQVIRADFKLEGIIRKTEMLDFLPHDYNSFLFLDSDTQVIDDVSLGFIKAEAHGLALTPAPTYSLENFHSFLKIMETEGLPPLGQMHYNTGVLFFVRSDPIDRLFGLWKEITIRNCHREEHHSDQPYFSLALEQLSFNPYTLPATFNYRARGEPIRGRVRIWHSRYPVPENINVVPQLLHNYRLLPQRSVIEDEVVWTGKKGTLWGRLRRIWHSGWSTLTRSRK
jgi:hypothetical protein